MRITVVSLFVCVCTLFATEVDSQNARVSMHANNFTVQKVISEIEKQTDYLFVYDRNEVNVNRKVSLNVYDESVSNVLNRVFENTNVSYKVLGKNITLTAQKMVLSTPSQQQNDRRIIGTVTDSKGEPVVGANVVVKGTTNGTITDENGKFTLNDAKKGDMLEISFIGYTSQNILLSGQSSLKIVLKEDTQALEEVVVIGYGTAKKKDLSGSVVRADLSTLKESPNVSLGSSLQGTVPGLNVGAVTTAGSDPSISIRGRNSISGGTSPLIVLDGIIYHGSLVDINANDIESIDILKDASAAAIYGSQASNGVMLITSKSVKAMSKPIIEYSGSYSIQDATTGKMKPMSRDGFLQLIADRFLSESRSGSDLSTPNAGWDVGNHLMDSNAVNGYLNGTDTNWWKLLTNDHPYIQMHNLSVRGKSELSNYFMSFGYTDQKNLIMNDDYKRYNIRLNLDTKITNFLRLGAQTFFTLSDYPKVAPSVSDVYDLPPIVALKDENDDYITYPYKWFLNPMLEIKQDRERKRYNFFGNFYVDLDVPYIKGLNYRLNVSQNLTNNKNYNFNPYGANLTGSGYKDNSSQYDWTVDNILTYKRSFGLHDVNATLVYGAEKRKYEYTDASGENYANNKLGYNYLGAADAAQQYIASSAWKETSLYSMFRLAYTYNNRYIFTGTVRRDGFSGFGSNNKFAWFPSAAIAWRISEEDFFKNNVKWCDDLKLRLSYGSNGNRTVSRYQTLSTMGSLDAYLYGDGGAAEKGIYIRSLANNNLKWETTNTFNFGMDFSLLQGRVFGTMELYSSKTHNLLYNINIPYMNNNISSVPSNIGKLQNHGVELSVTGIPVKTKDFQWDVTFNFSLNRNKVKSILGIDANNDGKEDDLISSKIFIGKPYGVCYDFKQTGMWQMSDYIAGNIPAGFTYGTYKVKDVDGDGKYTAANDREILGYTDPSYRFSIQNTLRYKGWQLKVFINSIQGGKNYYYGQPGSSLQNPDNIYQYNSFKFDYWTPENPNARYRQIGYFSPALGYTYSPYIQRNFVRLQDVTLSYTFPKTILSKIGVNNLKVYLTGKNLLTFSDWDGWDPETGSGLTMGAYPLLRNYSVGINFDF